MERVKEYWWKILAILLILYGIIGGFTVKVPQLEVIGDSIRNIFFHVGMWFAMMTCMIASVVYSLKHLRSFKIESDIASAESVKTGLFFGILGLGTGMIWAYHTWGVFWISDPKLNGTAISMVIYLSYLILRSSVSEMSKRGRIAAVYNIFAFALYLLFIIVIPRISDQSIHPGQEDNPVLPMDLDPSMRVVFYPAMVGWMLLAGWIMQVRIKIAKMNFKILDV